VMVEDDGVSVEGVAKVDREGPSARPSWGWEIFFSLCGFFLFCEAAFPSLPWNN
jgi:hypothetical protein